MIKKLLSGKPNADKNPSAAQVVDDESGQQLVELFNKRNELKRAFDRTAAERDQLLAEVTTLRKTNAEMASKLSGLEKALKDPRVAPNVLVYYGLQDVWLQCRKLMADTAQTLRGKLEDNERGVLMQSYSRRQSGELDTLTKELDDLNAQIDELSARKRELEKALLKANQIWHFFRRKKLRHQISEIRKQRVPLERDRDDQMVKVDAVRDKEPPRYSGLSRTAMRAANTHLIALAQYFYVFFANDNISSLAHEANKKLPHEVNYGGLQTCLDLQKKINTACAALKKADKRSEHVSKRAEHLKAELRYADEKSTVPEPGSINSIQKNPSSSNLSATLVANVIDLDSWNLTQYFLVPDESKNRPKQRS